MDVTNTTDNMKLQVKEGATYRLKISFMVNKDIVAGLKLVQSISRGVPVSKNRFMVGSFGPKAELQTWTSPEDTFVEGMLARGTYKVKSKFTDDDNNIIHSWEYELKIAKDWK